MLLKSSKTNLQNKLNLLLLSLLAFNFSLSSLANQNTKTEPKKEVKKIIKNEVIGCSNSISLKELVSEPEKWLNKEICIDGVFSSFSALALDYPPAMRERRKYVSLTLFRSNTQIPLGELKLAMSLDTAQHHEALTKIAENDLVKIKGKVFSVALGEPWMDINQIQIVKKSDNKDSINEIFSESE
jgi:hypothetical protein